ncbi:MAG: hypothetical protein SFZ24_12705 [Planctomycetota bacterium]|nr:hypothetical protein [Planctomycetota bacterium]
MRSWIWPLLVVLMLASTGAVLWVTASGEQREAQRLARAIESLDALQRQVRIRAATDGTTLNSRGWPVTIDPAWFSGEVPLNPYVPSDYPWVEIASSYEAQLADPAIRQAVSRHVAAYWYNPATGIVRARVGPRVTDAEAVELYNTINGTRVEALFGGGATIERDLRARLNKPRAHKPNAQADAASSAADAP